MSPIDFRLSHARRRAGPLAAPVIAVFLAVLAHGGSVAQSTAYNWALSSVYGMVVLSVSLLAGWGGVWSIGHPAMFAIGSYTAAYGSTHGWSLEVVLVVAAVLPAVSGALLGYAGSRFSVLYIALLTMAFNLVVLEIIGRWTGVTGGDQGTPVSTLTSSIGSVRIDAAGGAVEAAIVAFGLTLGCATAIRRTSLRMRQVAAKSHAAAGRSVGISHELQTALGFAISGAVTGIAGVLLAAMTGFVSPDSFSIGLATNVIAAAVLGGVGSIAGAVVGGGFLTYAGSLADALGMSQPILQGIVLITVLLLLPLGTVPSLIRLAARIRRALPVPGGRPDAAATAPITGTAAGGSVLLPEADGRREPVSDEPILVVHDLGVRFGGLKALDQVSLEVRRGEVLGVIGPNGAGKTTLINVLSGLPAGGRISGEVTYRGKNLLRTRPTARRRLGIARTFQHAELFGELTVLENVLCTHRLVSRGTRQEALAMLDRVGLSAVAHRLPSELSFGIQKRADLARAVAAAPEVLVLDEPFGGLDTDERAATAALIRELRAAGTSIVIVDHVIEDLFALVDRVVAFDFGTPIGSGPPQEILHEPRVRSSYLGSTDAMPVLARDAGRADRPAAVRLRGIGHHYDGVTALREVDLEIPAGTLFGIAGANGAGKSTIGRILAGGLSPSGGARELVEGPDPARPSLVPEGRALFKTLTIRENLEVAAYGAGLRGPALRSRLDEALEGLPQRIRDRQQITTGSLSGGEQQLVAIARGLVCRPTLLILDEPALGLAPAMVEEVYRRIGELADSGITVVLLEQLLGRAMAACSQVAVLRDGLIVDQGSPADPDFATRAERAYFGTIGEGAPR
jgi:ABC-type branched-subunit amino acid transport system ATPase component/ABC-type branched-subunit amino acid transport system permease subunit